MNAEDGSKIEIYMYILSTERNICGHAKYFEPTLTTRVIIK